METTKIQLKLAQKLGDPVTIHTENGVIYSAELRRQYLQRAYANLIQLIDNITLLKKPSFLQRTKLFYKECSDENIYIPEITEVKEIIFHTKKGYIKGNFIKPEDWVSVETSINNLYKPTFENMYWTYIDTEIRFQPHKSFAEDNDVIGMYITAIVEPIINFELKYFNLSSDYEDLLLDLACIEGVSDIGDVTKLQLYRGNVTWKLNIIQNKQVYEDNKR